VRVLAGAGAAQRFPLIAEGAYHLDRASVDAAVESLCAVGVNTLSLPGPVREAWGERRHAELMLAYTEEQALRAGLALAHHRRSLVPGRQPGEPLEPCPLTADFRRALDEHTRPMLAAADRVPRLRLHEIAPESAVRPEQLCRCAACRTAYERSFGGEMPAPGATADEPGSHHALCSFVSSYWWHVYSLLRKVRSEVAAGVRLSLPFGSDSFLREAGEATYCDAFSWLRACEVAEVLPERDAARYRLSLSGHRALCAALGKPLGALIELGNPCLPPAETAYTALANGASHLRVAGNPRFLFGRRQPPLERGLGRLFARIAKAGPLLARSQRPRARVALLFPFTQVVDGGSEGLLGPFELLCAAFGEVDLVHQRLARDERIGAYAAVALLGTRLLPKKAARQLARFVEHGGLLLADRADLVDEKGRPLPWPDGFFGTAETPVFEGVTRRQRAFGAGRTVLFSAEIGAAYRRAVEREDVLAARALSRAVADALAARGVRPQARSASRAVEVGLRLCGGARLLVAVNHSDEPQQARVDIDPADGAIACAFDLLSGEELTVEHGEAPALDLPLAPREGGVWGLYPQRPFSLRLELRHDALVAGDALQYTASVVDEAGQAIAASHILRVFVTDPAGAERPDLGGEMTTTDGVLEVTQPLAVNDLPGQWTLCATDVLTRRIVRRTFTVAPAAPGSPGSEPADASGTSDKSDPSDQSDRSDRSDPPEGPDEPTKSSDTIS